MATKTDRESRTIGLKLVILAVLFYVLFYVITGIMEGGFRYGENGRLPFEWASFNPTVFGKPMAAFLATGATFFLLPFIIFAVVRAFTFAWDYAVTLGLLHFVITCLVNIQFPVNWIWWVTVLTGVVWSVLVSEFLCYRWEMRAIQLE